jgi:hypothetical protein
MTDEAPPEEAPPELAPAPEPLRCPSCLAPVEPDQEYCLECGARLEPPSRPPRGPLGVPLWAAIAAAMVLLLGGFVIAWGFTRGSGSSTSAATQTATGPHTATFTAPPSSQIGTGTASIPSITGTSTITATTTVTVSTGSGTTSTTNGSDCGGQPTSAADDSWPNGRNGWMAVLSSKPTDTYTFADFCQRLQKAQSQGFTNLGILDSTDYASLNPGYWVLFEGPFDTHAQAAAAAQSAQADWPGAYPRQITDAP